jgi:hypothetical protein
MFHGGDMLAAKLILNNVTSQHRATNIGCNFCCEINVPTAVIMVVFFL